ncbi:uncharacterized protein LOC119548057 [Drosophila subpulchrella]|uniref:uncharacterized protein LOC119548057 n=1 Tax=Drosophila subpulchrella TaxID=1486046 RepID=UPI0018A12D52|nr:uncharacterized protein LOC119548057 [Drosophila subpulchrella]XP_037711069.1 uncharacterized protein LOC119548057 [Drosophila subpulchrella]
MLNSRSPPQYKQHSPGGSVGSVGSAGSIASVNSTSSASQLLGHYQSAYGQQGQHSHACYQHQLQQQHQQQQKHQQYHHHQHHHHGGRTSLTPTMKRGKKQWGTRERSGMSFLIVITFFAVFGLIILTEVFMIDERTHSGMLAMRAGGGGGASLGGRMGDSMPDYDNVKDDYDLLDASILSDNKLGFIQLRDNKLKIQEAAGADGQRLAGMLLNGGGGGGAGAFGVNVPLIPWGQVLPGKVEETLPHFPFGTRPTDGAWQVVNGTRFKFFVYSAYFDRREGARLVRVVGATKTRGPERVWCRFWYGPSAANASDGGSSSSSTRAKYSSATVMARVKIIRENWNLKYSACFILCPVRSPPLAVPHFVSVVSRLRAPPGNLLILRNTDQDADFAASTARNASARKGLPVGRPPPSGDNIPDRIAVCVKPLHFNYDQALYLMEYLEFYALLGVSHFTFYNHTLGPHASCVLQSYQQGLVPANLTAHDLEPLLPAEAANNATPRVLRTQYERPTLSILPWNLRMRSQKEIRTEGLFAALNDCLYRTMYRYKYLALVDLDEFIVPRYSDTLNELIRSLNQRFRNRNTGAYSFQNAFYYLQFADDSLASSGIEGGNDQLASVRASLVTQRKTRRRYKLHPQKQRSKYICKPEAVVEAGNHFVWEFAPGKGSLNVPPKEAILQHYRVCEFGGNDCIKAPSIVDRTTTKYVNRLVQRVDAVYRHLRQRCDLPALPPLPKTKEKPKEMAKEKPKYEAKEKPKLLQKMRESKAKDPRSLGVTTKESLIKGMAVTAAPTTKTTTTTKATTKRVTTKKQQLQKSIPVTTPMITTARTSTAPKQSHPSANVRKKRKLIVFEINDFGIPVARVEYQ